MSDKTYNGWSNYETWNCALWLDNDQGTYEMFRERAQEFVNDSGSIEEATSDAYQLGDEIDAYIEEQMPELGASMFSDLLRAAVGEINFREIAEHMIADCEEPAKDDEVST